MSTYQEMNSQIVSILRIGESTQAHYAADRIEELEKENVKLRKALTKIYVDTQSETAWEALK